MPRKKIPLKKLKENLGKKIFVSKRKWCIRAVILAIAIALVSWYLLYY